jgi:hypothetical protein
MANAKSYTDYLLDEQQKAQNTPAPAANATPSAAPGYADYLAGLAKATGGGQKQVVSAAPAPAGQGYADWLVTMQKNHTVENTPTNAMSYADYLLYMGSDPAGDYKAKVEDANKTYAGAVHSHGKNKEAMVAAGLAGSGYGEYLVSTAYAERARSIENAQSAAKAGMEQSKKSYADYLVDLRAENEKAAYTGIVTGQLTGEAARKFAIDKGVTEDRLDVILGQASSAIDAVVGQATQSASDAEKKTLASATSDVSTIMANGGTIDAAMQQLTGIYDDATLNTVKKNYQSANMANAQAVVNAMKGVGGIGELTDMKDSKQISDEAYTAMVEQVKGNNAEYITNHVMNGDYSVLAEYAKANGLAVPTDTATADAVIEHMYGAGVLSNDVRQERYAKNWINTITKDRGSASDLVGTMEQLQASRNEGRISHDQYVELLKAVGERAESIYGKVEAPCLKHNGFDSPGEVRVSYKQGDLGMEDIQIYASFSPNAVYENEITDDTEYFVEGKGFAPIHAAYADTCKGAYFGTIGGRPVAKFVYTDDTVRYFDILKSDEDYTDDDNAFLTYMCTPEKKKGG